MSTVTTHSSAIASSLGIHVRAVSIAHPLFTVGGCVSKDAIVAADAPPSAPIAFVGTGIVVVVGGGGGSAADPPPEEVGR